MRLLGLSRKAFLVVLVGVLALGATGIAIARHKDRPSSDRVQTTTFRAVEQARSERDCTGDDGQPYVELKQRLTGEAGPGDPRFTGDIVVHQRVLIRFTPPEPIGQAFGTVLYTDPATGRKKAFVTFLATLELGAGPSIRAEGAFYGDVFARPKIAHPLNFGRVISNFTSQVALDAKSAEGQFGAGPDTRAGRDEPANTGVLMKGDCGLGFAKAYRKTFRHAPGAGHRADEDRGRGRAKSRGRGGDKGRGRGRSDR